MAATAKCFPLVRGKAMRVTKLDGCGVPVPGPASQVVSEGFVSIALTVQTDEGTTISVQTANGKTCIRDVPPPEFLGYAAEVQFCGVNPDLFALMTGQPVVKNGDATPLSVGMRMNTDVDLSTLGFALESWSTVPGAACADGNTAYGYFLLPFLRGGVLSDFTIANDAVNFTVTGALTKNGNGWGVGPYNVTLDETGTAGPLLEALDPNDHLLLQLVEVAPPTEGDCGAQALGQPATGATAGTPGTLTPANSYAPQTLADLSTVTATPETAWTTGQYIELGDGSDAYWDGSTWVAGIAP